MEQCSVESRVYGVLSGSISPVSKLVWVEGGWQEQHDVIMDQFFEALHHHGGECYWLVVVEARNVGFLGNEAIVADLRQAGTMDWDNDGETSHYGMFHSDYQRENFVSLKNA